jgi:hypothetical protein
MCVHMCVSERSCVYICVSERSCVYICVLVNGHVCTTNTKYHNVETVSKCYGQIIETETKLIPLTHMYTHDRSLTHMYTHDRCLFFILPLLEFLNWNVCTCVSERSCVYICVLVNGHVYTYVC